MVCLLKLGCLLGYACLSQYHQPASCRVAQSCPRQVALEGEVAIADEFTITVTDAGSAVMQAAASVNDFATTHAGNAEVEAAASVTGVAGAAAAPVADNETARVAPPVCVGPQRGARREGDYASLAGKRRAPKK